MKIIMHILTGDVSDIILAMRAVRSLEQQPDQELVGLTFQGSTLKASAIRRKSCITVTVWKP